LITPLLAEWLIEKINCSIDGIDKPEVEGLKVES
jgi:hypothetical protein